MLSACNCNRFLSCVYKEPENLSLSVIIQDIDSGKWDVLSS